MDHPSNAMTPVSELIEQLEQALLASDKRRAQAILQGYEASTDPVAWTEALVIPAMERIGQGWETGRVSLAQVYTSGRLIEELVKTTPPTAPAPPLRQPRLALVTLQDYHLLGKRLVYSVLSASGYRVADYCRMEAAELVERLIADETQIVLISTLMLPSALQVRAVRAQLIARGRPEVKLIVGGAPFRLDRHLWQEVGADACGQTAAEAAGLVRRLAEAVPA